MSGIKIIFVGLPSSGKTTFLAALWDSINTKGSNKELELDNLKDCENEYLNFIRREWLKYSSVTRTNNTMLQATSMNLKDSSNGEKFTINIPDIKGETFRDQFSTREWSDEYKKIIDDVNGLVLFITPKDKNARPQLLRDAIRAERDLHKALKVANTIIEPSKVMEVTEQSYKENKFIAYSHEHTPSQVKLVDFLQMLHYQKNFDNAVKLSVVVSAWDTIPETTITPEDWVKNHLPLLHQYISCNDDLYDPKYFGVSAQGGDYDLEQDMDILYEIKPIDRVKVKVNNEIKKDISLPITWIIR